MSRYIDANAYIKYCEEKWIPLNIDAVKKQPTVDMVEIITDELTREISERIIQVLEASDEIIIKKPVLKVSEYLHSFVPTSVEYRKSVEWEHLVRCKNCEYRDPGTGLCEGRGWPMQLVPGDGFCDKGERRDDGD